ncbi:Ger(x)C family spore germination protein [Rossellomorea aquimaris]|uniref:Ger(x)C family spore germination protein n=1 Tax=Rossellomorea aquimaris TaxID=189382 RepID=UPI001CD63BA3|nr:Ger(x)C family spore germination protein [Rossellomorea aquimaris]MCA1053973.1 Ger(x)C family spore germination protein [Rossellomorea aquimaris]
MKKVKRFIMGSLILSLLTSCADVKTLEQMGLITTVGYDSMDGETIHTTMLILETDPQSMESSNVISNDSLTSKGARIKANLKSPKKLASGQLRVALYGMGVAKSGFINLADTLARDHAISDLTYLAVVDGEAGEILEHKYEQFADAGQYIFKEIEQNIKGETIPSPTLHEILHKYYSVGIDPSLPLLKLKDDMITIIGMAILKDDKLVGSITPEQAFYVKLVNDHYDAGNFEMTIQNGNGKKLLKKEEESELIGISLDTIKSKSLITLTKEKPVEFDLKIKLNARLQEINKSIDLNDSKNLDLLDERIKKEMTKKVEELIQYCQSVDSDVFGFGEVYRSSVPHSGLTKKEWHSMYKDIKVNVSIDFDIVRTGVVE